MLLFLQNMGKERENLQELKRFPEESTHKHTETHLKYFNGHRRFSQSKESKCMWTHSKDGVTRVFERCHQGVVREEGGGEEGMQGKLNGNYLRLIQGLCLEDRMNL